MRHSRTRRSKKTALQGLDGENGRQLERRRLKYNIIGLLALLLIIILATDAGGCGHWLGTIVLGE